MNSQRKSRVLLLLLAVYILGMLFWQLVSSDRQLSDTERRALKQFPELSVKTVENGKFMGEFETYTQDQFPARDMFRGIKSFSSLYVFGHKEVNDLYLKDGVVAKVEYPLEDAMISYATQRFRFLYEEFMQNTDVKIYSCIVPDKHYFLGKANGYPSMDYDKLEQDFKAQTSYMEYVPIMDLLSIEDYYRTDSHWRQEKLLPVAKRLGEAFGVSVLDEAAYERLTYEEPFYGVYAGQLSLPLEPDNLVYLSNEMLEECTVTSYDTGRPTEGFLYDMKKAAGRDPYELFLSGSAALLTIENPGAATDKELVVFRDSFGSSLIPLLVSGYEKITLVDIRYMQSNMVGNFVEFIDQDVLFLYSTLMLNNSRSFK